MNNNTGSANKTKKYDVVVIGAGFSGMYLLHRLRESGFTVRVIEAGDNVGGTWYWNKYPGARVDTPSIEYSYSFDPELEKVWNWSEKYAPQAELLRYANFVADRYDLRRDIEFSTRVDSAFWNDEERYWKLHTSQDEHIICKYYIMASGALSIPKEIDIPGIKLFKGESYLTGRWPDHQVDFSGKRVAVIGTGSSGIQSIPIIAKTAKHVTVFQRTPCFSMPANNGPIPEHLLKRYLNDRNAFREVERHSQGGIVCDESILSALAVSEDERNATYEKVWEREGVFGLLACYSDHFINKEANNLLAEFFRNKIRSIVKNPETAETLCPKTYPIGAKRLCVDTNYYATYNLPHVRLVDLHKRPIKTITEKGIDLVDESLEFDMIVFATGFDAMTGALVNVNITGRNNLTLKEAWKNGPTTYLGLMTNNFPNLFMITGPGSPSVLSNMFVSIEQHVEWVNECLVNLRKEKLDTIEPTEKAVSGWVQHVNDFANITLFHQANSWYMGANVPGKKRIFMPYVGGVGEYRLICDEVIAKDYLGFERLGPSGGRCNDGIIREVQPDVIIMLRRMKQMGLPPLESLSVAEARAVVEAMSAVRPPGPEVGEIIDSTLPGPAGALEYRLYKPPSVGPHPIIVYFHGGGWVFGNAKSDDSFCRDLCVRSRAIVISVNYRHAPESRFPAPVDDAFSAVKWVSENNSKLGGIPGKLVVAGWSAGANLAAVVCQLARDAGGPQIAGQVLIAPLTDGIEVRPSKIENAEGYILTTALINWFWDHYCDPIDRNDPRASPLQAVTLSNLPPAFVVTCQFDPLRDEGKAYADAMAAAGVKVNHLYCRGQIHYSLTGVGMIPSSDEAREEVGKAIHSFFEFSKPQVKEESHKLAA